MKSLSLLTPREREEGGEAHNAHGFHPEEGEIPSSLTHASRGKKKSTTFPK